MRAACAGLVLAGVATHALAERFAIPVAKPRLSAPAPLAETLPLPKRKPARPVVTSAAPTRSTEAPAGLRTCLATLAAANVAFTREPAIRSGACGTPHPVKVTAIGDVALSPPALVRCPIAAATTIWLTEVVQPAARKHLRSPVQSIGVAASYTCRMRRGGGRGAGKRLSEHGRANAIDIGRVGLANGRVVEVAERSRPSAERRFQRAVREGACMHFTTVIGPGTDAAHAHHFHLDLAERRGGYRVCR